MKPVTENIAVAPCILLVSINQLKRVLIYATETGSSTFQRKRGNLVGPVTFVHALIVIISLAFFPPVALFATVAKVRPGKILQ